MAFLQMRRSREHFTTNVTTCVNLHAPQPALASVEAAIVLCSCNDTGIFHTHYWFSHRAPVIGVFRVCVVATIPGFVLARCCLARDRT